MSKPGKPLVEPPAEKLRKHIDSRVKKTLVDAGVNVGELKESQKKSPSQRKSEATKRRLERRR